MTSLDSSQPSTPSTTSTPTVPQIKSADNDDGKPSFNVLSDLMRVLKLIQQERHLVAYELFSSAKDRIDDFFENQKFHNANGEVQKKKPLVITIFFGGRSG